MRRTFAVALAAGVLLLGGCDRPHAQSSGPPAVGATTAPAAPAAKPVSKSHSPSAGGQPSADVAALLGDVDKQLGSDAQPAKDSD